MFLTLDSSITALFQVFIIYVDFAVLPNLCLNLHLISVSFLLHYSLTHLQLQLALQTWPLALLSAYFASIIFLYFKSSLWLHCLKVSWSGLDLDRKTGSGLDYCGQFSCQTCPGQPKRIYTLLTLNWLLYVLDAVYLPFLLPKWPSLLPTCRITIQESTHILLILEGLP